MSDPYANLAGEDQELQNRIADAMEARCLEPAQVAIRRAYLSGLDLPEGAIAVELRSGTGHVTRDLIDLAGASQAIGIEPSPVMVARSQAHFADRADLSFETGDAKSTRFTAASVEMVLMHTLLCHVPQPQ